jgi:hypothetical protein
MIKKCKFEVDVTYNSDFFAEGEIRETIKKAIRDLNDKKESAFGRRIMCNPGKTNSGVSCDVNQSIALSEESSCVVETLVSLSNYMDDEDESTMVLPEPKLEELMTEVRTAFKD